MSDDIDVLAYERLHAELRETIRERDEAREAARTMYSLCIGCEPDVYLVYERLRAELRETIRERDEAQEAARTMYNLCIGCEPEVIPEVELVRNHPWLEDDQ